MLFITIIYLFIIIIIIIIIIIVISKRHNILRIKTSFFISSAGKIQRVQELKIKLFEWLFHCR